MQDGRPLQDLSAVSIQQPPAHGGSSPDTQRVRPTDRQLTREEVVGYRFSGPRGRLHVTEQTGALTTALDLSTSRDERVAIVLPGRAGEQTLPGQRSQICLGRTEKWCAKHFAPCHRCRRDFDRCHAVVQSEIMQCLENASEHA
jgi:hypothetical protein